MGKGPRETPLGILLHNAARAAERAFDNTLRRAGGSGSRWRILRSLSHGKAETQSALAASVGLRGATLVHHLNELEAEGLVERTRNQDNRRLQSVALTDAGLARFRNMLGDVITYDAALRASVGASQEAALRRALQSILATFGDGENAD